LSISASISGRFASTEERLVGAQSDLMLAHKFGARINLIFSRSSCPGFSYGAGEGGPSGLNPMLNDGFLIRYEKCFALSIRCGALKPCFSEKG
jgi:hypothetical protein